jgi:hypothetical protein
VTTPLPDVAGLPTHTPSGYSPWSPTTPPHCPTPCNSATSHPPPQSRHLDEQPDPADPVTAGDLARATLHYLATTPQHQQVVARVAAIPAEATRLEPATLTIGALVVLALRPRSNSAATNTTNGN